MKKLNEFSDGEIDLFYDIRKAFHFEDAKNHVEDHMEHEKDEKKKKYLSELTDAQYENLVERFEQCHDCNVAENDLWESVIEDLLDDGYEHVIWSSEPDLKDWESELKEDYPGKTDEELVQIMYELNDEQRLNEAENLSTIKPDHQIIVIADLGHWNGRNRRIAQIGKDMEEVFNCVLNGYSCEIQSSFYVKNGELYADAVHHDATDYYHFRVMKKDMEWADVENALEKDIHSIIDMTEPLGNEVAKVYGW